MDESDKTRPALASRLGVSVPTLRKWEGEFSNWLRTPPGRLGQGQKKIYLDDDVLTLATIHRLREEGFTYDDIRARLDAELATATPDDIPDAPGDAPAPSVGLSLYMDTVRALEATEGELRAVSAERDRLLEDLKSERSARLDAERRAAFAEGKASAGQNVSQDASQDTATDTDAQRQPRWWRRWFG
jgi:DNA-binding transcriptional MerR regulator